MYVLTSTVNQANLSIKYLHEHLTKSARRTQSAAPPSSSRRLLRLLRPLLRPLPLLRTSTSTRERSSRRTLRASLRARRALAAAHDDTGDLRSTSARKGICEQRTERLLRDAMAGASRWILVGHMQKVYSVVLDLQNTQNGGDSWNEWMVGTFCCFLCLAPPSSLLSSRSPSLIISPSPAFALAAATHCYGCIRGTRFAYPPRRAPSLPPSNTSPTLSLPSLRTRVESPCCKSSPAGLRLRRHAWAELRTYGTRICRVPRIRATLLLLCPSSLHPRVTIAHSFLRPGRSLPHHIPCLALYLSLPFLFTRSIHTMCLCSFE
ncbi:hypothetical protein B0H10DRAFT_2230395 [Mycena sp. CBHHK59/15]|nr:hypothetical protein B0H10DRAFT_2230395 [Mycena sp. CBHHK59/15]